MAKKNAKRGGNRQRSRNNQRGGEYVANEESSSLNQSPLQAGGNANGAGPAVPSSNIVGGNNGAVMPAAASISPQQMEQAKSIAEGLLQNLANGQKGGSGDVAAYESSKGISGSPLMGGRSRRNSRAYSSRQRNQSSNQNSSSKQQRGGMMPGVMSAIETALVPLGLYLGQKALQSRRGRSSSSSYKPFNRRFSRRRSRRN